MTRRHVDPKGLVPGACAASDASVSFRADMKILTLTQPWATLVAVGAKRIETRSWRTDYRGPIAIHAAKTLNGIFRGAGPADLAAIVRREPFASALAPLTRDADEEERLFGLPTRVVSLPMGQIIAVVDLVDVVSTADSPRWLSHVQSDPRERDFGDYSPGRYAWLLENVRPLPVPYEIRGERGLQTLDPRVARYIAKEIQEVHA